MLCPKCHSKDFYAEAACSQCGFRGPLARLEKLAALDFLLAELKTWDDLPVAQREALHHRYLSQHRALEEELGLVRRVLTVEEAAAARRDLARVEYVLTALPNLRRRGLDIFGEVDAGLQQQITLLRARLQDAPPTPPLPVEETALDCCRFLANSLRQWQALGKLPRSRFLPPILQMLEDEMRWRTAQLSLLAANAVHPEEIPPQGVAAPEAAAPATAPAPAAVFPLPAVPQPASSPPPAPPPPPHRPWTWDRFWETLLSERTVYAMLFLGVTLLVAAVISWVVWKWDTFPPWGQMASLAAFTGLFYGLGWYVRTPLKLAGSGVALSAFASLLIPFDFYAFYRSEGFPQERWPEMWLGASLVCLVAYGMSVYFIQAEFFGYLVGLAAGSALAAGLRLANVDSTWWQVALSVLALGIGLGGEALFRFGRGRWKVLAAPLWRLALVAAAVILALHFGWGFTLRSGDLNFRLALALDAWLAGLLYLVAVWRMPSRTFALAAALCFPLAALLSEGAYFPPAHLGLTWYALGLALMAPLYLALGWRFGRPGLPDPLRIPGETAGGVGRLLVLLAAVWAFFNASVATLLHPWLALTLVLVARWWKAPRWLYFVTLLLLTGGGAFVASRGLPLAQMGLAWALLAIALAAVACCLEGRRPAADGQQGGPDYVTPLYVGAWLVAALALLPPLVFTDRPLLAYVLGHWTAFNGWLALLRHEGRLAGLAAWVQRRHLPATIFQWFSALGLLLWVGQLWRNLPEPRPHLELVSLLLAIALLGWGTLLRRVQRAYGSPWHTAAHLCALAAVGIALTAEQPWPAWIWLGAAAFYFAAARLQAQPFWMWPGAALLPLGLIFELNWLQVDGSAFPAALAAVAGAYFLAGKVLERLKTWGRAFFVPLAYMAYGLSLVTFTWGMWRLALGARSDTDLLWVAVADLILGLAYAGWAWVEHNSFSAYLATWLVAMAFGLAASAYSRGSGRSAALAALLSLAYMLLERGLRWGACAPGRKGFWRRAWRLYRWPLLASAALVSVFTILLALGRNLLLLGGGRLQATWAAVALSVVTGLYVLSARLYFRWRPAPYFAGLAAVLAILPWSVFTYLGWYLWPRPAAVDYALAWALLALLEWGVGLALMAYAGWKRHARLAAFSSGVRDVAQVLLPFALLWGIGSPRLSSLTFGLAVLFYLLATWLDWRLVPQRVTARFLYPAAWLFPVWALQLLAYFDPSAQRLAYGFVLLAFALPALALGRWLASRQPAYRWPLYALAYGLLLPGTILVSHERLALMAAFLLWTVMMGLSAWMFRRPAALYPAATALAIAWGLGMAEIDLVLEYRYGWGFLLLAALYLLGAFGLRRRWAEPPGAPATEDATLSGVKFLRSCASPLVAVAFALLSIALPLTGQSYLGLLVGYTGAALLLGLAALWLRQPLLLTPALGLTGLAYWRLLVEWKPVDYGLALWPWILVALAAAYVADRWAPAEAWPAFPWTKFVDWPEALLRRWLGWWAFPFYAGACVAAAYTLFLSGHEARYGLLNTLLAAGVYALVLARFRLRGWLLACALALQLAAVHAIRWWDGASSPAEFMLAFAPVTWATLLAGVWLERRFGEGPLNWKNLDAGWSRPLYGLLGVDLLLGQMAAIGPGAAGVWGTFSNALALALLATCWRSAWLAALAEIGCFVTLNLGLSWQRADPLAWPWALMLLALGYGLSGYALRYGRYRGRENNRLQFWERPLCWGAWALVALSLYQAWALGINVLYLVVRAMLSQPLLGEGEIQQVQMMVAVLSLVGVFILTAAVVERKRWLAYGAVVFLLGAWSLEWLLIWGLREVQWYVIPVGLYLLAIGYLEWSGGWPGARGSPAERSLARWVDRAAMLLLLGSAFWQSLGDHGGRYALLMGVEALVIAWWGSARRLRRFLYTGVVAVVLDVAGQLIDPLLSADSWIVFAVTGSGLLVLAILAERRLRAVEWRLKGAFPLAEQIRKRLEEWE